MPDEELIVLSLAAWADAEITRDTDEDKELK